MSTQMLTPGTAVWTLRVAEGLKVDGDRNWRLGDIALEIAPMNAHGSNQHVGGEYPGTLLAHLVRYAEEIGVNVESLKVYRRVAAAWPPASRVAGTSWKAHANLMGAPHKLVPGMTVTQAHAAAGHSTLSRQPVGRSHREDSLRVESEPGPATEYRERMADRRRNEPPRQRSTEALLQDLMDSERVNDAIRRMVERARGGYMDAMPADLKEEADALLAAWIEAMQWVRVVIKGGAVTDKALADFLNAQT